MTSPDLTQANIDKARTQLGFEPTHDVRAGMIEAADWYIASARKAQGG